MSMLFELYSTKDREIEELSLNHYVMIQDKNLLEKRRNLAFDSLLEIMTDRRRLLNFINEKDGYMMSL